MVSRFHDEVNSALTCPSRTRGSSNIWRVVLRCFKGTSLPKTWFVSKGWPFSKGSSLSSILEPRGSLWHHRWFHNQFPPSFSVRHCPLGLGELQACPFLDEQVKEIKRKLTIENFVLKCSVDFIFNLESYLLRWRLAGLDVENSLKCHRWSNGYLRPNWFFFLRRQYNFFLTAFGWRVVLCGCVIS